MAFDFPPAQDGLRVTNPESGVTYVYRDKYQSWIIEAVDNKQVKIYTVCCTPCDAAQGDLWFNPCTNCLNVYHDGDWLPVVDCSSLNECVGYKGEKQHVGQLPATGNELGDLWVVLEEAALYLYSTNGWIPADRYDDHELRKLLQEETDARTEADKQLNQKINKEKRERKEEDQKLWDALKQETSDRVAGDEALYDKLEECCTNAQDGLADLQGQLDQEIKDRELGDSAQQGLINHLAADLGGTNDRLDQEIQDRIDGDDTLHQEIVEEAKYRDAYDKHLLELIREKESKYMGEVEDRSQLPKTRYDWKPLTHFQCETIYSMSWGPDCFIAGTSDGHVWSSDDGLQWERRHVGVPFNGNVTATFYAHGTWLIGGDGGFLSRSVDGKNWHNFGNSTTTSNIQDFAFGGGKFVYVTDGGVVALSEDAGATWTKQDHTIRWGVHGIDSILTVTYSEHLSCFVAGTRRGMILVSDTGVGWELRDPNLFGTGQILSIASCEWLDQPTLIAAGDFPDRLTYSVDGENWVSASRDYFKGAVPTDLKPCNDGTNQYVVCALSDGSTAFASDKQAQSWTIEATGAGERLLAIAYAPKNSNVGYPKGIHVTGGNFGQALARLPGSGLEPGDTWIVLNPHKCLYTWSSKGWIINCSGIGGGGGEADGILQLTSDDGSIRFNPATGVPDPSGVLDLSAVVSGGSGGAQLGENPPATPENGDLWIREPENKLYFWDGHFWVEITSSGGGSSGGGGGSFGSKFPKNPQPGDRHVDDKTFVDYVWTGDEWIQVGSIGGGSSAGGTSFGPSFPTSPIEGQRHVDENSLFDYVWTGDEWIQIGSAGSIGSASGTSFGPDFPDSPIEGQRHVDEDKMIDYVWTGDEWIQVGSTGGCSSSGGTSYGSEFPDSPIEGQRHVDEDKMIDYVFTGDQWIQISGVPGAKRNVGMLDNLDS